MVRTASKNELLPGTLEMLILQTLTRSAMHGYGIAQHIQEITDEVLQVEEGSLYPALQRLLLKGWVKGEWGTSDNNRRARFYTLTAAGRKQLEIEAENFKRLIEAIARVMQTA
jgi:PadR family transcriptional regulator